MLLLCSISLLYFFNAHSTVPLAYMICLLLVVVSDRLEICSDIHVHSSFASRAASAVFFIKLSLESAKNSLLRMFEALLSFTYDSGRAV